MICEQPLTQNHDPANKSTWVSFYSVYLKNPARISYLKVQAIN